MSEGDRLLQSPRNGVATPMSTPSDGSPDHPRLYSDSSFRRKAMETENAVPHSSIASFRSDGVEEMSDSQRHLVMPNMSVTGRRFKDDNDVRNTSSRSHNTDISMGDDEPSPFVDGDPDGQESWKASALGALRFVASAAARGLVLSVIASLLALVYGFALPWTIPVSEQRDRSRFFRPWVVVAFDFFPRIFELPITACLQVALLHGSQYTSRLVLLVAIPSALVFGGTFLALFLAAVQVWFLDIDILFFVAIYAFAIVASLALCHRWAHHRTDDEAIPASSWSFSRQLVLVALPVNIVVLGVGLFDAFFMKAYIEADDTKKFFLRVVIFPLLVDPMMSAAEFATRKAGSVNAPGLAQALIVAQVAFFVLGRLLILIVDNLLLATLMSLGVLLKDLLIHRISRQQCYVAYRATKALLFWRPPMLPFRQVFMNPAFQSYRCSLLAEDVISEFTSALLMPVMLISFYSHRSLYNFSYKAVSFPHRGGLDYGLIVSNSAIQMAHVLVLMFGIALIERRVNRVDLTKILIARTRLRLLSQLIVFLWVVQFMMGLVRQTPNFLICGSTDVCTCVFKKEFGCPVAAEPHNVSLTRTLIFRP